MNLALKTQLYDAGISPENKDWLLLHRNENLFIKRKWQNQIAKRVLSALDLPLYPDMLSAELKAGLARLYQLDHGQLYVGNGADGVLADLFCFFRKHFDTIVVQNPGYRVYSLLAERYAYKIEFFSHQTLQSKRLYVLDSPNSITGESLPSSLLARISADPSSFLIWDNVYGEFAKNNIMPEETQKNRIVVRSFSKYYGLASLRVGYCMADPKWVVGLNKQKDVFPVNGFAQLMALQMLNEKAVLETLADQMLHCKQVLEKELEKLNFLLSCSDTNFCYVKHAFLNAELIQKNLEENLIAVRRFKDDVLTDPFLRITVPPPKQLMHFIKILKKILK